MILFQLSILLEYTLSLYKKLTPRNNEELSGGRSPERPHEAEFLSTLTKLCSLSSSLADARPLTAVVRCELSLPPHPPGSVSVCDDARLFVSVLTTHVGLLVLQGEAR